MTTLDRGSRPGEFARPGPAAAFKQCKGLTQVRRVAKKVTGTRIRFWPDPQVFVRDAQWSLEALAQRARQTAYLVPGLTIRIVDERPPDGPHEEVFRFDPEDTLVLRVRFENTGESEVIYQPQRLAVRVGANVYYASIADASGIVPPKATTVAYFAVTGTPRGGRANLSVKNTFSVIVSRVERDAKLVVPDRS